MPRSRTAPSVLERRERSAASSARAAAENQPRLSARGRPRRVDASAALYCLTVRLTPAERTQVQAAAAASGLSIADYARLQLGGRARAPRPHVVDLPAVVDTDYARTITTLGNTTNQLARCWNSAVALVGTGEPFRREERDALRVATERLVGLLDEIAPVQKGPLGRLMAAARLAIGKPRSP
jgi:hypothetical protein